MTLPQRLFSIAGAAAAALSCAPSTADLPGSNTTPLALPCDIAEIMAEYCWTCHGEPLQSGPMPLIHLGDVHAPSLSNPSVSVLEQIKVRLHDPVRPMPDGNKPLPPDKLAILDNWLAQGAPEDNGTACSGPPPSPTGGGSGGSGGYGGGPPTDGGGIYIPPDADLGDGGLTAPPPLVPPEPGECQRYKFAAGSGPGPFPLPQGTTDRYQCFYFDIPWEGTAQSLAFESKVTNGPVVHHWLLYSVAPGHVNGSSESCLGVHPDGTLLAGWAPGATDWYVPKDVGMELPVRGQQQLMLEVHYNNLGPATTDESGVEVCATTNLRPQTAGIHWLGTEAIAIFPNSKGSAFGNCAPALTEPVYMLRTWPHMHVTGTRMFADITRANGTVQRWFDEPFDFGSQRAYDYFNVLYPGDQITTTCEFENPNLGPVFFGPGTGAEMCYNFVVAYPTGRLRTAGLHNNACM